MKTNICLIGAGRMGSLHAHHISKSNYGNLHSVVDIDSEQGSKVASMYGAKFYDSVQEALSDPLLKAVLISTTTPSHAKIIIECANAGMAILCEKPIDTNVKNIERALETVRRKKVPILVGFNRRFDKNFHALHDRVRKGEIGKLEMLVISSKDQKLPAIEFLKNSGGLFRDMMIHDIDMARWIMNDEFEEVYATGSCLVSNEIESFGDVDTSMVIMKTKDGKLCHINNSRRSVYGYDQRLEAFGSKGMLQISNPTKTSISKFCEDGISKDAIYGSFPDRYEDAYINEIDHFIQVVEGVSKPLISGEDSLKTLLLANAIDNSFRTGEVIRL